MILYHFNVFVLVLVIVIYLIGFHLSSFYDFDYCTSVVPSDDDGCGWG